MSKLATFAREPGHYSGRIYFGNGVWVEHIRGAKYCWLDPFDGSRRDYIKAENIVYTATLGGEIVRSKES